MTFNSLYPPICIKGEYSNKWYIIADGVWHQVTRRYDWEEIKTMWVKKEYASPPQKIVKSNSRTYMETYKVEGSKGKVYTVTNISNVWSCSCPAHGFGRGKDCKHIIQLKTKQL